MDFNGVRKTRARLTFTTISGTIMFCRFLLRVFLLVDGDSYWNYLQLGQPLAMTDFDTYHADNENDREIFLQRAFLGKYDTLK